MRVITEKIHLGVSAPYFSTSSILNASPLIGACDCLEIPPKWEMKHRTHIIGHSFLVMSPFPCLYASLSKFLLMTVDRLQQNWVFSQSSEIFIWQQQCCVMAVTKMDIKICKPENYMYSWSTLSSSWQCQSWKPTLSAQTLGNCGIGFSDSPTYFKVMSTPRHPSKVCTMLSSRSSISSYSRSRFSSAAFTAFSSCLKIIGMLQDAFKSHLLYSVPWFHSIVPTERLKQLRNDAGIKKASTWM